MAEVMEIHTENDLQYTFYPVASGAVRFQVRASNDAHIALTTSPYDSSPIIEVFIGASRNTKSVIRKNKEKKISVEAHDYLDANEFRSFYIRWDAGVVQAFREGDRVAFMSWEDPNPDFIKFVGVRTAHGSTGTWKIEDGEEFDTPDSLEYKFGPVSAGSLELTFRGPHDCHICLTNSPVDINPKYEIILGGWKNTQSVIRRNGKKPHEIAVHHGIEGIVDRNKDRAFLIQWGYGRLLVRDADMPRSAPSDLIMEWTDPAPFPIAFFGVRTGYGASGIWRITRYFKSNDNPHDSHKTENYEVEPGYNTPSVKPPKYNPGVWSGASNGHIPPGAMGGGQDVSGEPMYVARALHEGAWLPGKLVPSHKCAYVPWDGKEHAKTNYQVLIGGSNYWMPARGSDIPKNAFPAGVSENEETLFIGRVEHKGGVTIGKVHPSHGRCFIPFDGEELSFEKYEILVK